MDPDHAADVPVGRRWQRGHPRNWGIATRAAAVSAAVVLTALAVATAGLLALLYGMLLSGVDDAAGGRVTEIVSALKTEGPAEIDETLFATNQRVAAVQILGPDGRVTRGSSGAPADPLAPAARFGPTATQGLSEDSPAADGMRLSGQTVDAPNGHYTVIVGGASEAVEGTVRTVAILLAAISPLVMAEAAYVSYALVKRSLRSVDAIRSRVAEITVTDLSRRVPVPVSRDEISALAETMNAMLERLEAGNRAQRQFVGDASHELRSPLATIIYALEVVEAHPELLDVELATGTLLPEAHRMKTLVEDLLLLARADEKGLARRTEVVDLGAVVAGQGARVRRVGRVAVDVVVDGAAGQVLIGGDEAALTRMVGNLLDNAARHARSRIEVSVRSEPGAAIVVIADDGPGIPVADRVRVFDRFVRLDTDRSRRGGGSGLGLAIVAEIVAAHHGSITLTDTTTGGTHITITLPSRH